MEDSIIGRKLFKKVYTVWSDQPLGMLSFQKMADKVESGDAHYTDSREEVVDESDWHESVEDWYEDREEEEEEEEEEDDESSSFDQRGQNVKNQLKF